LRNSNGLKQQQRKYIDITEAQDHVKQILEIVIPHYQHMYKYRLRIPQTVKILI